MSQEKEFQRIDVLLGNAFAHKAETSATPGFESRVMARIMELRREPSLWDVLRGVAKPILYSGWAAAAVLALVVVFGQESANQQVLASVMSGSPVTQWLVL